MKPRRIIIFSLSYDPSNIGGAEVAIKEITDRISPHEVAFEMITLGNGRGVVEEKIGNITIHRIFKNVGLVSKFLFPFVAARKASKLNAERPYGATWSIMASFAGYAGYIFKKNNPETPFILTIQEGDHFGRRTLLKPLFKRIFSSADRVQAISHFLADWAKVMGAKCSVDIIPNGVDVELFSKKISEVEALELEKKLGKGKDDAFLITTSRLVEKNAVGNVIEALRLLPENVKFLVLGRGPLESKLKVQASKVKGIGRVQFLEYIPHSDMPKYLQVSDIFIRPSLSEGFGNSFIEAMAAGIPVIATPVGGIPDFLKDGETGLFCEVNNPRSIAQKVDKLLKDRESREYIVKQAMEMVKINYQWSMVAEMMKEIFVDVGHRHEASV